MHITTRSFALILTPLLLAACMSPYPPANTTASSSSSPNVGADIEVTQPVAGSQVSSPLTIQGRARGSWYFEASFGARLVDDQGNELAAAPAQAQGDWMTADFVPFSSTLTFSTTATSGKIILENANPSGMPENAKSFEIPVTF